MFSHDSIDSDLIVHCHLFKQLVQYIVILTNHDVMFTNHNMRS